MQTAIPATAAVILGLCWARFAPAQVPREGSTSQQPAMTPEAAEGIEQERTATPPPGEEVMRPTSRGVRLTPKIARGIAGNYVREEILERVGKDLSQEQVSKLTDGIAARMMRISETRGREAAGFLELMYESFIAGEGTVPPDRREEFARQARSALPAMREFFDGVGQEARLHLDPGSLDALQEHLDAARRMMDRFEQRMQRWSQGPIDENEEGRPFEGLEDDDQPGGDGLRESREIRQARRSARWELRRIGPDEWRRFWGRAREVLEFDEAQKARGERILNDCVARAREIMTPEWEREVRELAVRRRLVGMLEDANLAPYRFHLDHRWRQLTGPLEEMGKTFRREIMALATADQQARVMAAVAEKAARHGMSEAELAAASAILFGPSPR